MLRQVDKIFARQPLDLGGKGSRQQRPLGYFGLPMVNLGRPPLSPNKPYC